MKKMLLGLGIYGVFGAGLSFSKTLIECHDKEVRPRKTLILTEEDGEIRFKAEICNYYFHGQCMDAFYEKENEAFIKNGLTYEGSDGEIIFKVPFAFGIEYYDQATKISFSKEQCKFNS